MNIIALVQSIGPIVGRKVSMVLKTGPAPRVLTLVQMVCLVARLP